jgi:DNA-binding NtrC family response regulator
MTKARVLVVDDDASMRELSEFYLRSQGYEVATAETGEEALKLNGGERFDVALMDLLLPDTDGITLVERFKEITPEVEIIMISGFGSLSKAVEATKAGAFYFVEKPVKFEELIILIDKALERRRQAEEITQLRGRLSSRNSYYDIIGGSKSMQSIYETIESVAESDANILIVGESGTGKELIANAIHYKSHRSKKPFVKINCSALPKELIESELFGHTKGAFTGANADKAGLVSRAEGGSLLLDEIGEMPLELQPKLLRVLQERVFYRIGSEKAQDTDFRLIASTNRDPLKAISEGHLRDDLFYRINTIEIRVPPLRERAEDVQHLASHFLQEFREKYQRPARTISQQAYERLFAHSWPGNVRELRNVIERAVLLCKQETIEWDGLSFGTVVTTPEPSAVRGIQEDSSFEQIARMIVERLASPHSRAPRTDVFKHLEGVVIAAALERTKGNKQAAAKLLGVYRPRLYSILRRHQPGSAEESDQDYENEPLDETRHFSAAEGAQPA